MPARRRRPGTRPQRPPRGDDRSGDADDRRRPRQGRARIDQPAHERTPTHTSDGAVAVIVGPSERGIDFSVEDTGDGLSRDGARHVFDRFWKADDARTRSDGGGAGLGLAIARGLVEAHGGTIWAEPTPGGGARFVFAIAIAGNGSS